MPYKMNSGKWRAERMFDGKRKTRTFQTKAEAKKWEVEQKPEPPETIPTHTAYSAATEYLDHCKSEMATRTYEEKRTHFKIFFKVVKPDTDFEAITAKQVYDVLRDRAKISGHAANRCRKDLKAWSAWVKKIHGLESKAFEQSKWRADETVRHVPTEDEFWQAYNTARAEDKVFLLTLLHTAARVGELLRIQWSDIDFAARTIRLGTRKNVGGGMRYATIPMTQQLADALADHKRDALRSLYVFTKHNGADYAKRQNMMPDLCKRAKVEHFGFHAIRHLSASILGRAGVPLATIQAILRHANATTTSRYLHSLGVVEDVLDSVFQGNLHKPSTQAKIVNLK